MKIDYAKNWIRNSVILSKTIYLCVNECAFACSSMMLQFNIGVDVKET